MRHLRDEPLPENVYDAAEAIIIRYARKSTRLEPIDDATFQELRQHFSQEQIVDLCMTVGLSNMVNRFHATFLTDVDESTLTEVERGNPEPGVSPISFSQP